MIAELMSNMTETAQIWFSWGLKISMIVLVIFIAHFFTSFIAKFLRKHMKSRIEPTVLEITEIILKVIIYVAGFFIILRGLGIKGVLMPMLGSAGVLGIILGFAMKDSLSNIFAGIALFIDEPFKIGDMVKIGELTGRLYDIGLRSTQLKTFDNNLIILPNNFVAESHIINYSKSDPKIRVNIKVSISYESNLEKAKKLLIKVAKSDKNVLKEPEPDVWVNELGDSGIELELKVWIPNAQFRKITPSDLRGKIKKEFDKSGIEIPYPRMYMIDGGKAKRRKKH